MAPSIADSRQIALSDSRSPAPALLVWMSVQLLALVLAATRVPLSARYPTAGEALAVDVLMAAQIVAAALLFPWLLRDRLRLSTVVLTAIPFSQLAGLLANAEGGIVSRSAGAAAMWITVLGLWTPRIRHGERASLLAVAVAVAWTLGGVLLWYLRAEFASAVPLSPVVDAFIHGPLRIAALFAHGDSVIALLPLLLVGVAAALIPTTFAPAIHISREANDSC